MPCLTFSFRTQWNESATTSHCSYLGYSLSYLDIWGCTHCNIFLTISYMKNSMLSFDFCKVLNLTHFRSFFTGQSNIPKNARLFIMGSLIGCHGNGLSNCVKTLKNTTKLTIFLRSGNFLMKLRYFTILSVIPITMKIDIYDS